jgi:N-acetylmuramoyl-L-alanine amidase
MEQLLIGVTVLAKRVFAIILALLIVSDTSARGLTLIIDPGHGGEDGGAVSDGGLRESEVNLDISARLDQIMGLFGQTCLMTRADETIEYTESTVKARKAEDQKNRLRLIRAVGDAVLISVHQNKYPDSGPFGAQVFYAPTEGSREFAEALQQSLIAELDPRNYRAATKIRPEIYIMNNVKCPAVLVECGFLSNAREEALLRTGEYRLKIAAVVAAGFLRHYGGGILN